MADPAGTETVEETKKRKRDKPTLPEREHPAKTLSPRSPCGAISLGRRPSYPACALPCMCQLAGQRLADADA